jgi:hypothetical protein
MKEMNNEESKDGRSDNFYLRLLIYHISKECSEIGYCTSTLESARRSASRLEAFCMRVIIERNERSKREAFQLQKENPNGFKTDGTRYKTSEKSKAEGIKHSMDFDSGYLNGKIKHG